MAFLESFLTNKCCFQNISLTTHSQKSLHLHYFSICKIFGNLLYNKLQFQLKSFHRNHPIFEWNTGKNAVICEKICCTKMALSIISSNLMTNVSSDLRSKFKIQSFSVVQQNMRVTRRIVLPLLTKVVCFEGILQKDKFALLLFYWVTLIHFYVS